MRDETQPTKKEHKMEIYKDEKRVASWEPGIVGIYSKTTKKAMPVMQVHALVVSNKINTATTAALRKMGENPTNWRVIYRFGKADVVLPANVAEIIYKEANRLESEHRAKCEEIANRPENQERQAIRDLFAKAERIARSDSDDNVWLPAKLRADARAKLAAWLEKYPEAAKKEEAAKMMAEAADLRSKASGALFYDADGLLSHEDQQKRHDDFIKEAEALEAKARSAIGRE
jgi:hypothetical protein